MTVFVGTRKSNLLIAIIIFFVAIIVIAKFTMYPDEMTVAPVRVAFDISSGSVPKLDPADIRSISQGILIDNLYSRLVEFDNEGRIQAGVATRFYWSGDKLVFEFTGKVKTALGKTVDEIDAAVSLRRLLKLGSNTHVNLRPFLCEINSSKEVFFDCDAIRTEPNKLILTLRNPVFKPFILPALASVDFGIVPKDQINESDLTLKGNGETSGPYYLHKRNGEEDWTLKANDHYNIEISSPREVALISLDKKNAWDMFIDGDVDVVSTLNGLSPLNYERVSKVHGFVISKTLDIKLYFLKFSPRALTDFSSLQRFYLGQKFFKVMESGYPLPVDAKPTTQFFLDIGFGNLNKSQGSEILSLRSVKKDVAFSRKASFYLYRSVAKEFSIFRSIDEIKAVETDALPFMQKPEDRLDCFIGTTDTAYDESLSLLGYNFTQGTFGLSDKESAEWMTDYLETQEKKDRLEKIQSLHFEMLRQAITVPLFKAPYTAVSRNGFRVVLSPLYASTHFWKIERP